MSEETCFLFLLKFSHYWSSLTNFAHKKLLPLSFIAHTFCHRHTQACENSTQGKHLQRYKFTLIAITVHSVGNARCALIYRYWWIFITSWRLWVDVNIRETVYETLYCSSIIGETIILIMANSYRWPLVDIVKLYFRGTYQLIQGQISFIFLTCTASSHSSIRGEVMHFHRRFTICQ